MHNYTFWNINFNTEFWILKEIDIVEELSGRFNIIPQIAYSYYYNNARNSFCYLLLSSLISFVFLFFVCDSKIKLNYFLM